MKVYVVMGNDFPEAVYADKRAAERWCKEETERDKVLFEGRGVRIYRRVYPFELKEENHDQET